MTKEFMCAQCGKVFPKAWSDEESMAESKELFGEIAIEELAIVCDNCFKKMEQDILCSHAPESAKYCEHCYQRKEAGKLTTGPLMGRWHHGGGTLICGTLRIAREDFDTNPSDEFRKAVFDQIVRTMNDAANVAEAQKHNV